MGTAAPVPAVPHRALLGDPAVAAGGYAPWEGREREEGCRPRRAANPGASRGERASAGDCERSSAIGALPEPAGPTPQWVNGPGGLKRDGRGRVGGVRSRVRCCGYRGYRPVFAPPRVVQSVGRHAFVVIPLQGCHFSTAWPPRSGQEARDARRNRTPRSAPLSPARLRAGRHPRAPRPRGRALTHRARQGRGRANVRSGGRGPVAPRVGAGRFPRSGAEVIRTRASRPARRSLNAQIRGRPLAFACGCS